MFYNYNAFIFVFNHWKTIYRNIFLEMNGSFRAVFDTACFKMFKSSLLKEIIWVLELIFCEYYISVFLLLLIFRKK